MLTTLLVIDDSENSRKEIVAILKEAGLFDRYLEAQDGMEGFNVLLSEKPTLIISALVMPRMDGFKFLNLMHSHPDMRDIPVILLTGRSEHDTIIKGLNQGASDFVTKPFHVGELVARVRVQLKIRSLQAELRQSNELLKQSNELLTELSNTDPLTGLSNRRYLMDALNKELHRAKRSNQVLTLIMLDIDHFKEINDTFGHHSGDMVLDAVARVLQGKTRRYDIAARYGGEEFVLALPDTPPANAHTVAEHLRQAIEALSFASPMDRYRTTASFGIAAYPSPRVDDVDALLREADAALYRAKQSGRNRIEPAPA